MHSHKIIELSDFLARQPKSYVEIAKFLCMNTFNEERILNLILGELNEAGVVTPLAGFGWAEKDYQGFPDLPILSNSFLTNAIREQKVAIYH